jgi:hypothetical protein
LSVLSRAREKEGRPLWRPQSFLAVIAVKAMMVGMMVVTVVMMVAVVMMVVMTVAVPSCGWDGATDRDYTNDT